MSERPGKSRPMPAAPFDDPSIPVLTERLTLPELDLDITLPAFGPPDPGLAAPPAPAAEAAPAPNPAPAATPSRDTTAPPPPALLGSTFETDTWLVETIPMAPAPLDLSTLDLPSFDLPPLTPAPVAPPLPAPTSAPDFAADMAIPASLMRATPAPVAPAPSAPVFDHLPVAATAAPAPSAPAVDAPRLPSATELRASILEAIALNLPQDVESIVRRQLAPAIDGAVDAAVAQLVPEIRRAVAHSLHELISHAVQAELARLRETR